MALFYFGIWALFHLGLFHLGLFHLHAWHPPPLLRNRVIVNFLRAIGGKTGFSESETGLGKTGLCKTGLCKKETAFGKTGFDNTVFGKSESGLFFTTNMRFPFVFVFVFVYAIVRCCIHKKKNKRIKT